MRWQLSFVAIKLKSLTLRFSGPDMCRWQMCLQSDISVDASLGSRLDQAHEPRLEKGTAYALDKERAVQAAAHRWLCSSRKLSLMISALQQQTPAKSTVTVTATSAHVGNVAANKNQADARGDQAATKHPPTPRADQVKHLNTASC